MPASLVCCPLCSRPTLQFSPGEAANELKIRVTSPFLAPIEFTSLKRISPVSHSHPKNGQAVRIIVSSGIIVRLVHPPGTSPSGSLGDGLLNLCGNGFSADPRTLNKLPYGP